MSSKSQSSIVRSHASPLGDDELIVIDPMFDTHVSRSLLLSENYAEVFNTGYTHALAPEELDACLASLRERGLIVPRLTQKKLRYGLTVAGGALWESERRPDWQRYYGCWESQDDQDKWHLTVVVFSREIGEQFLRASKESGMYPDIEIDNVVWKPSAESPIYWKPTPQLWVAEFDRGHTGVGRTINWTLFRHPATWWACVGDLNEPGAISTGR